MSVELLNELAALSAELEATLVWGRMTGIRHLPAEPSLPRSELPVEVPEERGASTAPRPEPPRPLPPVAPPRPAPSPRPAAPAPRPAALFTPQESPSQGPQRSANMATGAWAALAVAPAPAPAPLAPPAGAPPLPAPPADGAAGAADLGELRRILGDCRRCRLCEGRQNIVFGVGDPRARLMVVGEGPGAREDEQGEPFVGEAGQMLDRMLSNVLGLGRQQVYIANMVKCRPPNNRNPEPEELLACRPFLDAQLRIVRPELILVLGGVAAKALFETTLGITRLRGNWKAWPLPGGGEARVMPTFHPAYLLRSPEYKGLTFEDLKKVRVALDSPRAP